jgi:predicted TIM-barrel fold metal-dependent hydrolase
MPLDELVHPSFGAIDVHAHTFNASDLSVGGFLSDVVLDTDEGKLSRLLDPLVRLLSRLIVNAPGAEAEIKHLNQLEAVAGGHLLLNVEATFAEEKIQRDSAFEALLTAEVQQLVRSTDEGDTDLLRAMADEAEVGLVPMTLDAQSVGGIVRGMLNAKRTIARLVRWVGRLQGYRHELISEFFRTYGDERGPVRLVTSSLVDYELWLEGDTPRTPIDLQIPLGARLTAAFPGKIHFFAPFDPRREAKFPNSSKGSFHWVKRAVEDHGFVGVKLYPPMGFAASGNSGLKFKGIKDSAAFGRDLDAALDRLFSWAEAEEVPLMAHSNLSQEAKHGYGERADPSYWKGALEAHKNLRVNFGHFGGQKNFADSKGWPAQIIQLMKDYPQVYGDVGMFNMQEGATRREWFNKVREILTSTPVLGSRLLYGSDWVMLAKEEGAADFLTNFATELAKICPVQTAQAVLGGNAAQYLGLRGGKTEIRLKRFYELQKLPLPIWLTS